MVAELFALFILLLAEWFICLIIDRFEGLFVEFMVDALAKIAGLAIAKLE